MKYNCLQPSYNVGRKTTTMATGRKNHISGRSEGTSHEKPRVLARDLTDAAMPAMPSTRYRSGVDMKIHKGR